MGEIVQMDQRGDTTVAWDPMNQQETETARDTFNRMVGQGYMAYTVPPGGGRGEMVREFDPEAAKIILAPRVAGG